MKFNFNEMDCLLRIDDFRDICDVYSEIISFGINEKKRIITKCYMECGEDETYAEEENRKLALFEYRMEALLLCCLSEVWEQNLFVLLKETIGRKEIKESDMPFELNDNNYGKIKGLYQKLFDINLDDYLLIKEMRDLVNVIKHGPGYSLESLKVKLGDELFLASNMDIIESDGTIRKIKEIEFSHTTLSERTLNIKGKLQEYLIEVEKSLFDINTNINL